METSGVSAGGGQRKEAEAVAEGLIAAREARAYRRLLPDIVPEQRQAVLATLVAIDGFLSMNEQLCTYVRDHVDVGLVEAIDQGQFAYRLGIFSRYVEVIETTVEPGCARVYFSVDGRLPAREAVFRWMDGRWLYDPGEGYDAALPEAFDQMRAGLADVLELLRSGRLSTEEIRRNPSVLMEEVRLRLLPGVRHLPTSGP